MYVFSIDSGVGAGIDSYYEYLLKAYVLLGDDSFLERFNTVSWSNFVLILEPSSFECQILIETQLFIFWKIIISKCVVVGFLSVFPDDIGQGTG